MEKECTAKCYVIVKLQESLIMTIKILKII